MFLAARNRSIAARRNPRPRAAFFFSEFPLRPATCSVFHPEALEIFRFCLWPVTEVLRPATNTQIFDYLGFNSIRSVSIAIISKGFSITVLNGLIELHNTQFNLISHYPKSQNPSSKFQSPNDKIQST